MNTHEAGRDGSNENITNFGKISKIRIIIILALCVVIALMIILYIRPAAGEENAPSVYDNSRISEYSLIVTAEESDIEII